MVLISTRGGLPMQYKALMLFQSNIMPQTPFIVNTYTMNFVGGNFVDETYEIENILNISNNRVIVPDKKPELDIIDIAIPYKLYRVDFYDIGPSNSNFYIRIRPYRQEFDVKETQFFAAKMDDGVIRVEDFNEYENDVKEISISLVYQAERFVLQILFNDVFIKQYEFNAYTIQEFYDGVKAAFREINYYVDIETNFEYNGLISYLQTVQGSGIQRIARYEKVKFYEGKLELQSQDHDFVPYPILYDIQGLYIKNRDQLSERDIERIENYYQYFDFQDTEKYGTFQSKFSIYNFGQYNGFLVKEGLQLQHEYIRAIMKYGYQKVFAEEKPDIYGLQFDKLSFPDLFLLKQDYELSTFRFLLTVYNKIIKDQIQDVFQDKLLGKRNIDRDIKLTQEEIDRIPYLTKADIISYTHDRRSGTVKITLKVDTIFQKHYIIEVEVVVS